jgi:PmbA protein
LEKLKEKLLHELFKHNLAGDIYIEENKRIEISSNNLAIDKSLEADSFGMGLRVFKDSKMGFGFSTVKDADGVEKFVDKVAAAIHIEGYDGYKPEGPAVTEEVKLNDERFDEISMARREERVLEIEASVCAADRLVKYAADTTSVDQRTSIHYLNTAGASYKYTKTYSYIFTSAIASDGSTDEAADMMEGASAWGSIDAKAAGTEAGQRAAKLLKGAPVKSGEYTLIIPPYAAVEFLQVIAPMFSGANLRKGKTLLAEYKSGDKIGQDILSLIDDAGLDLRAGSFPIDAEGVKGCQKTLIKDGKFDSFIHDKISARHFNVKSTGNASRNSYKSLPDVNVSNLYIPSGSLNTEAMLKQENGIYINSMMGLHMTDTVSGNFSLGINGWIFENGEKKQAVKEVLIAGNVKNFLAGISAIGDDMKFYFNFGSPTLVVKGITLAGK